MKVDLPDITKIRKKQKIIYIVIMAICLLSLTIAIYIQFFTTIGLSDLFGITTSELGNKSDEYIETLKAEFDENFTNKITNDNDEFNVKKDKEKSLVYTGYEKKDNKLNSYDIDVYIPHINIENDIINKYNEEIENLFISKAKNVLQSQNKNVIYTVEYVANIQDNILSIMIRSNLKEGSSAQRIIIQTYNYDLENNKEVTLKEWIESKQLDVAIIQNKIDTEIKFQQEKVKALKEIGYSIYDRDVNNSMYKIENTKEFYIKDDALYMIYAYGNNTFTSEMDLVIL